MLICQTSFPQVTFRADTSCSEPSQLYTVLTDGRIPWFLGTARAIVCDLSQNSLFVAAPGLSWELGESSAPSSAPPPATAIVTKICREIKKEPTRFSFDISKNYQLGPWQACQLMRQWWCILTQVTAKLLNLKQKIKYIVSPHKRD